MEWLAENAPKFYFVLGLAAVVAGMAGIMGKQKAWLAVAVVLALCIPAAWFVLQNVPTESKRLLADMESLRKAVLAKDKEAVLKHVADDFKYQTKKKGREAWYDIVEKKLAEYEIDDIRLEKVEVKKISRPDREASVSFHLVAKHGSETIWTADCPGWKFTLADDVWKLEHVALHGAKLKGSPVNSPAAAE
jgi:hypothetical protein